MPPITRPAPKSASSLGAQVLPGSSGQAASDADGKEQTEDARDDEVGHLNPSVLAQRQHAERVAA